MPAGDDPPQAEATDESLDDPPLRSRLGDAHISESACLFPYQDTDQQGTVGSGIALRCRRVFVGRHCISLSVAARNPEELDPDALGLHVWPGTHAMAHVILHLERSGGLQGRTLLDLGCGTGFLGILARLAGCGRVVLADCDERAVEAAALNVASNGTADVLVQRLAWGDAGGADADSAAVGGDTFDILLLSEVLYVAQPRTVPWRLDDGEVASLVRLAGARLRPGGVAWVTYGNREEGGAEQLGFAAKNVGLHCEELPLGDFVPADELGRKGAHALRRVRVFRLTHST